MSEIVEVERPPTVDELLDQIEFSFEGYIPSAEAFEFFTFIRLVLGEEPENENPLAHYFLVDCLFKQDNVKPFYDKLGIDFNDLAGHTAILCTREFAKSVLVGTFIPLYIAWKGKIPNYGKVNYGIYVGDSMRNNVRTTMNTIEQVYFESDWLQSQFESSRFTDELFELIRHPQTRREILAFNKAMEMGKKITHVPGRAKRKFALKGVGAATGTRGTRSGLQRPQFAMFDDLISSEADANSAVVLDNIEKTIESDVLNALHGSGSFAMIIGTPYNKKDPVYSRIESGAWLPVVFPIAKELSASTTKENFSGVWEDRHDYESVMKRYRQAVKSNNLRSFMQETMLRISSDDDRLITQDMILEFDRRDIISKANEYRWYATTDYTTTGSKGSDLSGIAIWAIGSNDDRFLVDLILKKMELEEQYRETFRLVRHYKRLGGNIEVGVEIDGQQGAHIYALQKMMTQEGMYFTLARQPGATRPGIRSARMKGSKLERFKHLLPHFQNNKFHFAKQLESLPDMKELREEIYYTTYDHLGAKHDDGMDLISLLGGMSIIAPVYTEAIKDVNDAVDAYNPMWDDDEDLMSSDGDSGLTSYIV